MSAEALLREIFGFEGFRPGQGEIVEAVAAGQDVLAIMPTGGGKSLCFQLPALMGAGVTVVISPLIALMRDQVRGLREAGVEAHALTSGNTEAETDALWDAMERGRLKLLYMAPERLGRSGMDRMLQRAGIARIAVDEAHCVSQWGHDFRPDYLRIGDLRRALGVPLAAFTATADTETRDEITEKLFEGRPPTTFLRGFDRPNIHLRFDAKAGPRRQITEFAAARQGQSGIVYTATRAKTQTLAAALRAEGHNALHYHGGMEAEDRRIVETRFSREDGLIVCATVAFGMGVDKPDIRWVAHADLPKSIEAYYQEIGRAGRDGASAETLTLYGADDIRLRRAQIDEGLAPPERKATDHGRLNTLLGLAEAQGCRRQLLLRYFGEDPPPCGNCDLCESPPEVFDGTEPVRMALSAMLRSGEWFGAGHIIDIVMGAKTEKIRARHHDALPTYGVGRAWDKPQWQAILRQMLGFDLARPDPERHGALRMTERARPILKGAETVLLRKDSVKAAPLRRVPREMVSDENAPLLALLKSRRRALAEAIRAPAYVIFPDRTLIEMAERRPATLDELAQVSGVGAKKLAKYGQTFLEVLRGGPEDVHPNRLKLAGRPEGPLYDRLEEAQLRLIRGLTGLEKPMSCTASTLRHIAERKPATREDLERLPGMTAQKADRFGAAFLELVREA